MKLVPCLPIILAFGAGLAGLSCADIAAPLRTDNYEWRLPVSKTTGGPDTLTFHWPAGRLPVKFWAQDTLGLPAHVQHGISQWQTAFLYGEFAGVLVSDSSTADVIVRTGSPTLVGFFLGSMAPECEGATFFDLPDGSSEIQVPFRVFINPRLPVSVPGMESCLALTSTHELGHALGIFAHSPVATDIMYSDPTVSELSARDRATAELAYHAQPTVTAGSR
jgi:predicted Zn-dependent protease